MPPCLIINKHTQPTPGQIYMVYCLLTYPDIATALNNRGDIDVVIKQFVPEYFFRFGIAGLV